MEETKESVEKNTKVKLDFFKNKKVIIAVVVAILIIAVIVTIFLVTRKKVKFKGESNGIKYSANMNENAEVFVVMKNKTGKAISKLNLTVSFYDANGNELKKRTKETSVGYLKNGEISFENVDANLANANDAASYKVEINPEFYEGEDKQSKYEKIEIGDIVMPKKDETKVNNCSVKIKNVSGDKINSACFIVAYFNKKGLPVGYEANNVFILEKDEEKELQFLEPTDSDGNKIDYKFCQIYIKY